MRSPAYAEASDDVVDVDGVGSLVDIIRITIANVGRHLHRHDGAASMHEYVL